MSVTLSPLGGAAAQLFNNNGVILSGGKLYSYAAGTTTPQATYTSNTGGTAHANPIILDSAGRVPGGEIWLDETLSYKFALYTSTDILIGTYDNISNVSGAFSTFSFTASYPSGSMGAVLQEAAFVFDNIAALRANGASGPDTSVIVQGYYTPGDLGGGVFNYDAADTTSPDNNGTIIVDADGRRWKRWLPDGSLNPQMFGAKCDLLNDDTAAVQDMFDAADSLTGNVIKFIGGQCLISDTVYIDYPVTVEGQGGQMQVSGTPYANVVMTNPTANLFEVRHSQANVFRNFGIRSGTTKTAGFDIVIVGDGVTQPIGTVFNNVYFNGSATCIGLQNCRHFSVTNCGFFNFGYNGTGNAIYYPSNSYPDSGDNYILGNTFQSRENNASPVHYGFAAIYVESTVALCISSNKFFGARFGIKIAAKDVSGNLLVTNNSFEQQADCHIQTEQLASGGSVGNLVIVGNEFSQLDSVANPVNPTQPTVFLSPGAFSAYLLNVIISNNVFNDSYTNTPSALCVGDGEGIIAQGNVFNFYNKTQPGAMQAYGNASNVQFLDNIFNNMGTDQHYKNGLNSDVVVRDSGLHYADLNSWANGSQVYVIDGTAGTPVTGGGTGSMAFRINTNWKGI